MKEPPLECGTGCANDGMLDAVYTPLVDIALVDIALVDIVICREQRWRNSTATMMSPAAQPGASATLPT
jgi:hypothetical protein